MKNNPTAPKIALVHDWLNTKVGGGEQVLLELSMLYPKADIYTLLFDAHTYRGLLDASRVHSSWLQKFPAFLRRRSRYLLPFAARAIEGFDLGGYDIVISTSSAFAKGVKTGASTFHLCYCFSPMRYVWDYWPRYLTEQHVGALRRAAIHLLTSRLRLWDYYSSKRVDSYIAISKTVQKRIAKYYHVKSSVLYPPVATADFFTKTTQKGDYFVTLASLTPYKKIDLAVEACSTGGHELVVIGDGSDRPRLERMAGPTVRFVGRVSQAEKVKLVTQAKALIFPNEEDFGIAPVEALSAGTPVIAYRRGGATETIVDGQTGVLFDEQSASGLSAALERFETLSFDQARLKSAALAFDRKKFLTDFDTQLKERFRDFKKNI